MSLTSMEDAGYAGLVNDPRGQLLCSVVINCYFESVNEREIPVFKNNQKF